jgi:hypothetical protein
VPKVLRRFSSHQVLGPQATTPPRDCLGGKIYYGRIAITDLLFYNITIVQVENSPLFPETSEGATAPNTPIMIDLPRKTVLLAGAILKREL